MPQASRGAGAAHTLMEHHGPARRGHPHRRPRTTPSELSAGPCAGARHIISHRSGPAL